MKQNRAILSFRQVAVCVEGSAAEGTLDQFKADVLFLLADPQMGIKKKKNLVLSFRPSHRPTTWAKLLVSNQEQVQDLLIHHCAFDTVQNKQCFNSKLIHNFTELR